MLLAYNRLAERKFGKCKAESHLTQNGIKEDPSAGILFTHLGCSHRVGGELRYVLPTCKMEIAGHRCTNYVTQSALYDQSNRRCHTHRASSTDELRCAVIKISSDEQAVRLLDVPGKPDFELVCNRAQKSGGIMSGLDANRCVIDGCQEIPPRENPGGWKRSGHAWRSFCLVHNPYDDRCEHGYTEKTCSPRHNPNIQRCPCWLSGGNVTAVTAVNSTAEVHSVHRHRDKVHNMHGPCDRYLLNFTLTGELRQVHRVWPNARETNWRCNSLEYSIPDRIF